MKEIVLYLIFALICFDLTHAVAETVNYAPKNRTSEELMTYVKKAVALIEEKGAAAYDELTDPNGSWVEGDFYVFINDFKGNVVAHQNKKLVGKNLYGVRDVKGKDFVAVGQETVRNEKGCGWYDWWWPKPNETEPSHKVGFVMRVPGRKLFVGSAIYDMDPKEVEKVLREQPCP